MKSILHLLILFVFVGSVKAQITTPIIKANFGIEADLEANYFNKSVQNGNDDWFNQYGAPYLGQGVIDTTGAASMISRYAIDPAFRKLPFYRTMSVAPFTIVNNRMWIDAVFSRDYHGDDSTMFASGSNKNGMSPQNWSCPVAQSVPDKNEILDMMVHVRRAGPTITDSLWMFGGLSIENTTGDRYFDFEMYQTDIYYDRPSLKFYGYGPDAGHTRWQFDAAGNVTVPGDIIFSAHYGSSTLSSIEARIWVDKASLSITPAGFSWNGSFDGAASGSQYGYAGIVPKSGGVFYTGMENDKNTWAGAFQLVRGDNQVVSDYTSGQFMEFGVNLTKLGLDPVTLLGSDNCGMPFRRVLVKSRASTSFTAALKDFVGPFDFFLAPRAELDADTTLLCGHVGLTKIEVINPSTNSVYTWSTPDGHINTYNSPTSIMVDTVGTYIVTQKLQAGCSDYAIDTVVLTTNPLCIILSDGIHDFKGRMIDNNVLLNWSVTANSGIQNFIIERSTDANNFLPIGQETNYSPEANNSFSFLDVKKGNVAGTYYRIQLKGIDNRIAYTKIIRLRNGPVEGLEIVPNPVRSNLKVKLTSSVNGNLDLNIFDLNGRLMMGLQKLVSAGTTIIELNQLQGWPRGIYIVNAILGKELFLKRMILTN